MSGGFPTTLGQYSKAKVEERIQSYYAEALKQCLINQTVILQVGAWGWNILGAWPSVGSVYGISEASVSPHPDLMNVLVLQVRVFRDTGH